MLKLQLEQTTVLNHNIMILLIRLYFNTEIMLYLHNNKPFYIQTAGKCCAHHKHNFLKLDYNLCKDFNTGPESGSSVVLKVDSEFGQS